MTTNFDPKYHRTSFVNLHAARTSTTSVSKSAQSKVTTQPFVSLLGTATDGYKQAPEKTQVTQDIAQAPSTPARGLWRKA